MLTSVESSRRFFAAQIFQEWNVEAWTYGTADCAVRRNVVDIGDRRI